MENTKYFRLNDYDREMISRGIFGGSTLREIALSLNRSPSTISREIRRNTQRHSWYCADCAQVLAESRARGRKKNKRKISLNENLEKYVREKLALFWSPEQIASRLKFEYPKDKSMRANKETIYAYIYAHPRGTLKKELIRCLRRKHAYRRERDGRLTREEKGLDWANIESRPKHVEGRKIPGHWEGDLVMGTRLKSAMGTLVERKTRFTLLVPVSATTSKRVTAAFARTMLKLPDHLRRSLTYDQGKEMARHYWFSRVTKINVYFAHTRSPWERGTNENTNGLLRQFFPKSTDFRKIPRKEIKRAQDLLNGRPRKILQYKTPSEVFNKMLR
jgi:IS30 family transposase